MAERPKLIAEALLRGRSLPPTSGAVAQALMGTPAPRPTSLYAQGLLGNNVGYGLSNYPTPPQPTLGQAFGKDAFEFASGLTAPLGSLNRMGLSMMGQPGGWQGLGDMADDASLLAGMATMSPGVPASGLGMGMRVFHGSPSGGLSELSPSSRGPLGPGVYATPHEGLARRYANMDGDGTVYEFDAPDEIFHGTKDPSWGSDVNPYQIWRDQKASVTNAAPSDKKDQIEALFNKLQPEDGYPFFARLSQIMGGDDEAQKLLKKAGYKGISGYVDGKELLMFDPVKLST